MKTELRNELIIFRLTNPSANVVGVQLIKCSDKPSASRYETFYICV